MFIKNDPPSYEREDKFTPFDIWEKGGLTEHLGGIYATRRLVTRCQLTAGQQILDVGCGTGFTACDLAKNHQVQIVALDINPRSITEARERISKQNANRQVRVVQADAHRPPFPDAIFDTVIVESVLVFCDAAAVIAEIRRVLKPGGIIGLNEFTFLESPPPGWFRYSLAQWAFTPFDKTRGNPSCEAQALQKSRLPFTA